MTKCPVRSLRTGHFLLFIFPYFDPKRGLKTDSPAIVHRSRLWYTDGDKKSDDI